MKVSNMIGRSGNSVANQFEISDAVLTINGEQKEGILFQSYSSNIAFKSGGKRYLDQDKWDYSKTTGKYRNQFLNETKKETEAKIKSGEYILVKMN